MWMHIVMAVFLLDNWHSLAIAQGGFQFESVVAAIDQGVQNAAAALKGDDPAARAEAEKALTTALPGYTELLLSVVPTLFTGPQRNQRLRLLEDIGGPAVPGLESGIAKANTSHRDFVRKGLWDDTDDDAMLSAASIFRARLALMRICAREKATAKLGLVRDPWGQPDATTIEANNLFKKRWEVAPGTSGLSVRLHFPVESGVLAISVYKPTTGKANIQYFFCRLETVAESTTLHCASVTDIGKSFRVQFSTEELRGGKSSLKIELKATSPEFAEFGHWTAGQEHSLLSVQQ